MEGGFRCQQPCEGPGKHESQRTEEQARQRSRRHRGLQDALALPGIILAEGNRGQEGRARGEQRTDGTQDQVNRQSLVYALQSQPAQLLSHQDAVEKHIDRAAEHSNDVREQRHQIQFFDEVAIALHGSRSV